MKSRIPPNYVNARSDVIYNHDISDGVAHTYICLAGLAWQDNQHKHLPELTGDELCQILNCKRSTLMGHLKKLRSLGFIKWKSQGGRFQIQIIPKIQSFGFSLNDDVIRKPFSKPQKVLTTTRKIQNSGFSSQEEENLAVLREFGVDLSSQEAMQIASLPDVEPKLIRAWGDYMVGQYPKKDISDFLLYKIQKTRALPNEEKRGGSRKSKVRTKSQEAKQTAFSSESISELPASVKADLLEIGWADSERKIEQAYKKDSKLLLAWLEYTKTLPEKEIRKSRAGFFRHGLRSGVYPPKLPAKKEYHDFTEDEDDFELDDSGDQPAQNLPINADPKLMPIWAIVLSQLEGKMPRSSFDTWLRDTYPLSLKKDILQVQVRDVEVRDWLDSRVKSTVENILVGVLNSRVVVQFVVGQE
ncbi:MAG: hypothetical protein ACT6FF_07465 [Methanosarcinaceae archaeon]